MEINMFDIACYFYFKGKNSKNKCYRLKARPSFASGWGKKVKIKPWT
jgi:hypothetical protein